LVNLDQGRRAEVLAGWKSLFGDDRVRNLQQIWLEFVEKDYSLAVVYRWLCVAVNVLHLLLCFQFVYGVL
jgi:hypothetical protein